MTPRVERYQGSSNRITLRGSILRTTGRMQVIYDGYASQDSASLQTTSRSSGLPAGCKSYAPGSASLQTATRYKPYTTAMLPRTPPHSPIWSPSYIQPRRLLKLHLRASANETYDDIQRHMTSNTKTHNNNRNIHHPVTEFPPTTPYTPLRVTQIGSSITHHPMAYLMRKFYKRGPFPPPAQLIITKKDT